MPVPTNQARITITHAADPTTVVARLQVLLGDAEWSTVGLFQLDREEWLHLADFCHRLHIAIHPQGVVPFPTTCS